MRPAPDITEVDVPRIALAPCALVLRPADRYAGLCDRLDVVDGVLELRPGSLALGRGADRAGLLHERGTQGGVVPEPLPDGERVRVERGGEWGGDHEGDELRPPPLPART